MNDGLDLVLTSASSTSKIQSVDHADIELQRGPVPQRTQSSQGHTEVEGEPEQEGAK